MFYSLLCVIRKREWCVETEFMALLLENHCVHKVTEVVVMNVANSTQCDPRPCCFFTCKWDNGFRRGGKFKGNTKAQKLYHLG